MNWVLGRAMRITLSPGTEWPEVKRESPVRCLPSALFVLTLACIPAGSWCVGSLLAGEITDLAQMARRGAIVYFSAVLSVGLVVASLVVVGPVFGAPRCWPRAAQLAAYSSAPVLIAGFLLLHPDLVFAILPAAFHGFYLQYAGVQHLLGVKEERAAEFVALEVMLFLLLSTLAGAFASWLGVI